MTDYENMTGMENTIKELFDLLQMAEGYIRSAVWREETEPPYVRNPRTVSDLARIQSALADLQKQLRS